MSFRSGARATPPKTNAGLRVRPEAGRAPNFRNGGNATNQQSVAPPKGQGFTNGVLGALSFIPGASQLAGALSAGVAIGEAYKGTNRAPAVSGRGAGRATFNPESTPQPGGKKSLPENQYRDRERTGVTRMGGVTYDLSIPHHRDLYEAAVKKNQDAIPDNQKGDIRGGGGMKSDGSGRHSLPPAPNPNGVDQVGTNTGFKGAGFSEANDMLARLGVTTTRYGDFTSNDLPTVDTAGNGGSDREAFGGTAEEDSIIQSGGFIETVIDGKQTEGSPKLTQSGAKPITSRVETAPLGSQQRYGQEFMADRPDMPAQYSTSMVGLRGAEASKGLLYASGKYWKANPNAGAEGEKDFVEIDKAEWNTIKRGDQHASQYKPSIADTDTTTETWKQSAQDFKNDYVGLLQQQMQSTDPKMGYTIADESRPNSPIDRTASVDTNVIQNAPTLTQAVDVRFTDKDRTGRYNNFNNR